MKCFIKGTYLAAFFSKYSFSTHLDFFFFLLLKIVKITFTQIMPLFRQSISENKVFCLKVWISSRCQVPAMNTTWILLPRSSYAHPVTKIRTAASPCRLPSITVAFTGQKKQPSRWRVHRFRSKVTRGEKEHKEKGNKHTPEKPTL